MASDEDYMAFLDKANKDLDEGRDLQKTQAAEDFKTTDVGVEVPKVLKDIVKDAFYISDADEEFVPVALVWEEGTLPTEEQFAKLISHPDPASADITIQGVSEWDPSSQYKDVVDATRKACKGGDVMVYRVSKGSVKAEYWLIGCHGKGKEGRIVGVKALAVES